MFMWLSFAYFLNNMTYRNFKQMSFSINYCSLIACTKCLKVTVSLVSSLLLEVEWIQFQKDLAIKIKCRTSARSSTRQIVCCTCYQSTSMHSCLHQWLLLSDNFVLWVSLACMCRQPYQTAFVCQTLLCEPYRLLFSRLCACLSIFILRRYRAKL